MLTLKNIHIKGFRSLSDINLPLQNLSVFIGKNNAGKSNILLAIKLLLEASTKDVADNDFYKNELEQAELIEIIGEFIVPPEYLDLCEAKHKPKIQNCIVDNVLTVRRQITKVDGKPKALALELKQPESGEYNTPTGIDAAFKQLLPEVIFIEAFKDPSEESKTKGTAALGKILKQIVEQVSDKINDDVMVALSEAEKKFNRIIQDGKESDDRPDELKRVEGRIKLHVQDVFSGSDVRLKFNLPNVSDLISTATVELKDRGPWTAPDGKGQGFQRILYVALLQTLADELRDETATVNRPFILLYEEPEAFLHPALQREVGNIIESISKTNQVIVASHSPVLVNPSRLENVVIVRQELAPNPHKTNFRIPDSSLFEHDDDRGMISLLKLNNTSEFLFSDYILVVEGVSDKLLLESSWSIVREKFDKKFETISIIESGGKDILPVWIGYLTKMGFPVKGCVDLDFLWRGSGKVLGDDDIVSKFCEKFWKMAEKADYCELDKNGKPKRSLKDGSKKEVFKFIIGDKPDKELNKWANHMFVELRKNNIWVLTQGEIEDYFKLSSSSKTQYVSVGQEIRSGKVEVPDEIEKILAWLFE
jgi:putative ATP-dependent endonuclease of the OLD family